MKEKVLSLARGNFIYETPELLLNPEKMEFDVASGEKKTVSLLVHNQLGSVIKGFGAVQDPALKFLPVFHAARNELAVEVDALELMPGECLTGKICLVTDCGEAEVPYEIHVVPPVLEDSRGPVKDYVALRRRIEENPENGAELFRDPKFKELFLFRYEPGKLLYDHLVKKNTKLQGMEEFLVAMGKKDPIRFTVSHNPSGSTREVQYELYGTDVRDALEVQVNTWGSAGIRVHTTADFIEPDLHSIWTDEFENRTYTLEYTILAAKVREGRRSGSIVFESPYERKEIRITARNTAGEEKRLAERNKKRSYAVFMRTFLTYQEGMMEWEEYRDFLKNSQERLEKMYPSFVLPIQGYCAVMLQDSIRILDFYQKAESLQLPKAGSDIPQVESYILVQYVKFLSTEKEEDREQVARFLEAYREKGYSSPVLFLLQLLVDEQYRNLGRKVEAIRKQLEQGENSPFFYSQLMRAYRQEADLMVSLDPVTLTALQYGMKHGLMTGELNMAVSFLAERVQDWNPMLFTVLERLYEKYGEADTLRSLCGMLIRSERMGKKYFPWFEKAVKERLRMTELYEYYMYTMNYARTFSLPDSVLSYFQYENHLNDQCKAFLYAYIVKKREEQPEYFRLYGSHIREFALSQLARHRISEEIGVIYECLFRRENIQGPVARDLPAVIFKQLLTCHNPNMESVVVVHTEMREEVVYPLDNGQAMIQLYTPNYQIFFVDREGHYLAGTVDYTLKRMLDLEEYAQLCWENGSENVHLLAHLALKFMRGVRLEEDQIALLNRVMEIECFRDHTQGKLLLCLYDYYKEQKETALLLKILERISPYHIKRERVGEIATACIHHGIYNGMYDKAVKMLRRYGIYSCDKRALAMLTAQQIQEMEGEFVPWLVKWSWYLYQERCYDAVIMNYLLKYYMGRTSVLAAIYKKCAAISKITIEDGSKERLLGQVLFTGENPADYEKMFLEYYASGENRILVKAFLFYYAYEYLVDHVDALPEAIFVKIEKEAFYVKDRVMVLATLKRYSREKSFAKKQQEFIERNLEECATEGLVLAFMKEFIGKVTVPYEIENAVLIQYCSGTEKAVFLHLKEENGREVVEPMKQVFDGIFTRQILLFCGEEKTWFIEEEETGRRTEEKVIKWPGGQEKASGFYQMLNQMIQAEQNEDWESYGRLRRQYEQRREAAATLFTIE